MSKEVGINSAHWVDSAEDLGEKVSDAEPQETYLICRRKAPKNSNKTSVYIKQIRRN